MYRDSIAVPRVRRATAVCVALGAALVVGTPGTAHAGGPFAWATAATIGKRLTVCANHLDLRPSRGGAPFARLHKGDQFKIGAVDHPYLSEWVHGFAYGKVNKNAYVQNGWFCST